MRKIFANNISRKFVLNEKFILSERFILDERFFLCEDDISEPIDYQKIKEENLKKLNNLGEMSNKTLITAANQILARSNAKEEFDKAFNSFAIIYTAALKNKSESENAEEILRDRKSVV